MLFNHAGTIVIKPFLEAAEEDWDMLFDVNVKSMYLMTHAVLQMMLEAGKGAIVCTSSICTVSATPMEVREPTPLGVDASEAAITAAQGRFGQPEDIARAAASVRPRPQCRVSLQKRPAIRRKSPPCHAALAPAAASSPGKAPPMPQMPIILR